MQLFPLLLVVLSASTALAADKPLNVVIIYCDDMGYADVGCFGGKIPTPNVDRLAKEGRRFTSFYVAQAVCSASRTALLTGCYPNRIGILGALGPNATHGIHDDETTIAEVLKPKGYATAIYGKWHLGHHAEFLPTRHGFDDYFGLPYSNDMWPKHPTSKFPDLPLVEGEKSIELNPDQRNLTTWYTERAVKFIEANRERPFFLYVPHSMPHVPLFVLEKNAGKSSVGLYGDVIQEIDWSVGQILETLDKHQLAQHTLVVFTSDNGPWLSYGHHAGSAGSLREGKGTSFEGGVRVPCVMRLPGTILAGSECPEPLMTIDLLPTIAKLAGAELPKLPIDGLDASACLTSDVRTPHESLNFYWGGALEAVRSGPWKLHFRHSYRSLDAPGKDGQPGKYVEKTIEESLFNLESDIGEAKNVAAEHPDVVAKLKALADKAREDLGDTATKRQGKGVRPAGKL